jgi:anti-sigma-K factor RskA
MKLTDRNLQILLAGEYVLGTLKGKARQRFAYLLRTRQDLQSAVSDWEQNLHPLISSVTPVIPPATLWGRIARDIERDKRLAKRPRSPGSWPWFALAASLAAFAFGALLATAVHQNARALTVAVLGTGARPAWVMTLAHRGRLLEVTAVHPVPRSAHSYQLWMLPGKGLAPRSLGLLPTGPGAHLRLAIPPGLHLATAQGLAVSLEPPRGSPLPGPSGPIVYEASWLHIV